MGNSLLPRGSCIVKAHLFLVGRNAESQRLVNRQRLASSDRACSHPFRKMVLRAEEHHIVRASQHDVFPPFRCWQRQVDQWLTMGPLRDQPLLSEMDLDVFRAMVTVGGCPLLSPQRYMNGHCVPRAIGKVILVLPRDLDPEGCHYA